MLTEVPKEHLYDVIIIGGGPAGLTAAIYLARARYRVLVLEKDHFGGQITITAEVVNYPGVPKVSGTELTNRMRRQAESFGAEFLLAEALELELEGSVKRVKTSRGERFCFGLLIAAGAHPRMVGFEGEETYKGHGVAYCATCDGEFFTGKNVFVVGGGFAAAEESVFLTKFASHVTILIRGEDFTCAKTVADQARNHEKISVLTNVEVVSVSGEQGLTLLQYKNRKNGELHEFRAKPGDSFGVFVFAGYEPATELVKGLVELDEQGYLLTDKTQKTSLEGVYGAGDVCVKPLRQVVTAVGEGALAATELEKYAARLQKETGLVPERIPTATQGGKSDAETEKTESSLLDTEMRAQLEAVFSRMAQPLTLLLRLDDRPVSQELLSYMKELASYSDQLTVVVERETEETNSAEELPLVRIRRADGSDCGMAFHGVPGGHEFTSFVLGLYNAAGPGQAVDEEIRVWAEAVKKPLALQIFVSLSCTMCPELVMAAQKLASMQPLMTAEVYDLSHFPAYQERYQIMSVPCLVVNNGEQVSFGKKNLAQLVAYLSAVQKKEE